MKKVIVVMLALGLLASLLLVDRSPKIAIVMTLSHPALESVREGFIKGFGEKKYIDFNAQGSLEQANLIAQKIAQDKSIIGIIAIGTMAAQTVAKAEKLRPIVVAAVSDPKLLPQNENICGLTDAISPHHQIQTIKRLLPYVKHVALLYSPSEPSSSSMVKGLAASLNEQGLKNTLVGVYEQQQIFLAALKACHSADAVLIPLDNQLVASMPTVIKATKSLPCPVIASNESPIKQGAAIAFGIDYYQSGLKASQLLNDLLEGQNAKEIGFLLPKDIALHFNDQVLKEKGIAIDQALVGGKNG